MKNSSNTMIAIGASEMRPVKSPAFDGCSKLIAPLLTFR